MQAKTERAFTGQTLTHMDENGRPRMVDVGEKPDTKRNAVAKGSIYMKPETLRRIKEGSIEKGDVLCVAQTAGIMAAKNTSNMIPMCHNIFITSVEMDFEIDEEKSAVHISASAGTVAKTGIEMESLSAVSVAALTIYDMCKAIDRAMRITDIRLVKKEGGKSGLYEEREEEREEESINMATVLSINISERVGEIKKPVDEAMLAEGGIKKDAHFGLSKVRQVSLLADESAEKIRQLGFNVTPGAFAENITTRGLALNTLPIGTRLSIGETVHEVSQHGKECHHGCAIKETTGTCVMPTEGIFTIVVKGGMIRTGDEIKVLQD